MTPLYVTALGVFSFEPPIERGAKKYNGEENTFGTLYLVGPTTDVVESGRNTWFVDERAGGNYPGTLIYFDPLTGLFR